MTEDQVRAILATIPEGDEDGIPTTRQMVVMFSDDRCVSGYVHSKDEPKWGILRIDSPYDNDSSFIDIAQIVCIEVNVKEDD